MERPSSNFEAAGTLAMETLATLGLSGSMGQSASSPPPSLLEEADDEVTPQQRLSHIVHTIEQDIIPRLLRSHADVRAVRQATRQAAARTGPPEPDAVEEATKLVLTGTEDGWAASIDAQLARGVSVEDIYIRLLAPAARELGRLWDEDLVSFTDVTLGVGRLQRAMRTLSPAFDQDKNGGTDGRRVLLIAAPGNGHSFGLMMVAEFFRRAGWDVVCDTSGDASDPVRRVAADWYDVVGISVGGDDQLSWLTAGLARVRDASRNPAIGVMVGGPVFSRDVNPAGTCGADCVVTDARLAPEVAQDLMCSRSGRLAAAA